MAENSKIEWTHHTVNFWWGCTKVSPACANCYAESQASRFHSGLWGDSGERRVRIEAATKEALRYQRKAEKEGVRFRVFTNSMADFFEDRRDLDGARLEALDVIRRTPNLDWLVLTKRPEKVVDLLERAYSLSEEKRHASSLAVWLYNWVDGMFLPANVWLGTTVEDQERADERVHHLLKAPAALRFLSMEPLLGPVDLTSLYVPGELDALRGTFDDGGVDTPVFHCPKLDWVIAGGESGARARPMHPDWVRGLRDQCAAAGVPFLLKQWGEWGPCPDRCYVTNDDRCQILSLDGRMEGRPWSGWHSQDSTRAVIFRHGKHKTGRLLDGVLHDAYPKVRP